MSLSLGTCALNVSHTLTFFHMLCRDDLWKLEYIGVFLRKSRSFISSILFILIRHCRIFVELIIHSLEALTLFFFSTTFLQHTIFLTYGNGFHRVSKIKRGYLCLLGGSCNFSNCFYLCRRRWSQMGFP